MIRLDKYLCDMGVGTRKEIKKIIKEKRVKVNENCAIKAEMKVDENKDEIIFDGKKIEYVKFVYIMLNKPAGYISATEDKKFPTAIELIEEQYLHYNVFCAGRLDIDTTGFLLMTNDGEFAHRLMSPKNHIAKKYFAHINLPVDETDIRKMHDGITLDDGYRCMSAKLEVLNANESGSDVFLTICEGKFHQVKRMFEAVGKKVMSLKRVEIGKVCLDENLQEGQMRLLTNEEILKIQKSLHDV